MTIWGRQAEAVVWGSNDLYSNLVIASKCFLNSSENSFGVPGLSFVTKQSNRGCGEIILHLSKIKRPFWCLLDRKNIKVLFLG